MSDNTLKVSVIMAAYNAEEYIEEAVNSILFQTMSQRDYEIIIINDGSTDRTHDIIEELKEKYDIISSVHKENGGPSSARNMGIEKAQGKYLFFFDADDILENAALEAMYLKMEENEAELCIGKYDKFDKIRTYPVKNINTMMEKDCTDRFDLDILWTFSLSNKMFCREIIMEHNLRLKPISYSEDGVFLFEYLYYCNKIIPLNKMVFHYRRAYADHSSSITSSFSTKKIEDYIKAHELIEEAIHRMFLKEYTEYETIEDGFAKNPKIREYLDYFYLKELKVLYDRFFSEVWKIDDEDFELITSEMIRRISMMSMTGIMKLAKRIPEFNVSSAPKCKNDMEKLTLFTVALYGEEGEKEDFISTLGSFYGQNMPFFKVILPKNKEKWVISKEINCSNISYIDAFSKEDFYDELIQKVDTPYIIFATPKIIYTKSLFRQFTKRLIRGNRDFVTEQVWIKSHGDVSPALASKIFLDSVEDYFRDHPNLCMDNLLENKAFQTSFLKRYFTGSDLVDENVWKKIYRKGSYRIYRDQSIIFKGNNEEYTQYVMTEETKEYIEKYMEDATVSLSNEELQPDYLVSLKKLMNLKKDRSVKVTQKEFEEFGKRPLVNRVLFVTVRADDKLEGNLLALYQHVKSPKQIIAKMLPHDEETQRNFVEMILTSKVIVTDDYVKYLRYFPLRESQRVIQIWHACGAFKKFGQRGTNISVNTDRATHAQYNLVCVSGDKVRSIYADAFDINYKKVRAVGVPRTDMFFDKKYSLLTKGKIYLKHPELIGKEVIVYAPTFRDGGKGRRVFEPEIDFAKLSENMKKNQVLLICPHPVMENEILDQTYKNIKVVRDFSTNDYMFVSDKLITDYSSVIFEYALLNKPMAFFCYDFERYDRGFYLNYPEDLPGDMYLTQDELMEFIEKPASEMNLDKEIQFVEKYMSACDGHSGKRIANMIQSYLEGK